MKKDPHDVHLCRLHVLLPVKRLPKHHLFHFSTAVSLFLTRHHDVHSESTAVLIKRQCLFTVNSRSDAIVTDENTKLWAEVTQAVIWTSALPCLTHTHTHAHTTLFPRTKSNRELYLAAKTKRRVLKVFTQVWLIGVKVLYSKWHSTLAETFKGLFFWPSDVQFSRKVWEKEGNDTRWGKRMGRRRKTGVWAVSNPEVKVQRRHKMMRIKS